MRTKRAFTLVELMLAMGVTSVLVVMLVTMTSSVSGAWRRGDAQAETHSTARGALTLVGRELQGAKIDLDLGFRVTPSNGNPNQFQLRFLTRGKPKGTELPPVTKVCYQMAWAEQKILPNIKANYDEEHPVPVLIRTESTLIDDVFNIESVTDVDRWTREWGNIPENGISPASQSATERTEIAAEYILGWRVTPLYWDNDRKQTVADVPGTGAKYYDKYLTSEVAPGAVEIELVTISSTGGRLAATFPNRWSDLRTFPWLTELQRGVSDAGTDVVPVEPFTDVLKQHATPFSATVYLQSRTP